VLILLSGPVQVGKTTLCLRLVERARERGLRVAGVLTPALMEEGSKVGIQAVELGSGETRLLARVDRDLGGTQVGPYCFDDRALNWMLECCKSALEGRGAEGLVFVDEIGKLELQRGGGLAPLIPLLARPGRVAARWNSGRWNSGPREQIVVVIVRDFLLDLLRERLSGVDARVVRVEASFREQAWRELADLAFGGTHDEAGPC